MTNAPGEQSNQQAGGNLAMSKTMLLYRNVRALSRDEHKGLRLAAADGFEFAAHTHWLPVAGVEFYQASRSYPIVFASEGQGNDEKITAILLTGLERDSNDYVSNDMQWKRDTYIPAFIRRYPFVLAGTPDNTREFTVCFDATFPGFNNKEGSLLFNEDGSETELLKNAVQFLNGFNNDLQRTNQFVAELRKLKLLEKRSADVRSAGGALFQIQDFLVVNEERFSKLTGSQLSHLHKNGYLGWIYAHLMSLANLPVLLELHMAKKNQLES